MENDEELPERLNGICVAATIRVAQLLAVHMHERITPAAMEEVKGAIELAVRAAAFEGARNAHETSYALTDGRLEDSPISKETRVVNKAKSGLPNGV